MAEQPDQRLKRAIIEVVRAQLRENDPPETKQTLERLLQQGFTEQEALKLIGERVRQIARCEPRSDPVALDSLRKRDAADEVARSAGGRSVSPEDRSAVGPCGHQPGSGECVPRHRRDRLDDKCHVVICEPRKHRQ